MKKWKDSVPFAKVTYILLIVIGVWYVCNQVVLLAAYGQDILINQDTIAVDTSQKQEGFSPVLYDNTNGLPTSEANAIAETKEGFLWIGSYSGLIRYDGNTFERMDSSLGIASVVSLFVDSKDRLWIGTNDSGVGVMKQGKITMYNKKDGLSSLYVLDILEDDSGRIYLATTQGMAYVDEKGKLHVIDEPQLNNQYIVQITKGPNDSIYGITRGNIIFVLKDGKLEQYYNAEEFGALGVRSIMADPTRKGCVYLGTTEANVYYVNLNEGPSILKEFDISPLYYSNSIYFVDGMIWICTDNGIGYIKQGNFSKVDNLPMNSSVDKMLVDYLGNLWFTSSKQGVMKVVPNQFSDVYEKYGLKEDVVYATCLYEDKLFVGTQTGGLKILGADGVEESFVVEECIYGDLVEEDVNLISMFEGYRIRSIVEDSKGRLWISSYGERALVCYHEGKVRAYGMADGLPSERVRTIKESRNGDIYVCCTGGLAVIRDGEIVKVYDEKFGIVNTEILTVEEMSDGRILLGTDGGGLYVIKDTQVTHYGVEDGLSSDVIMRIKKDVTRDIYWMVTSNAICYLDTKEKVTVISHFPYSNNFDFYENNKDEMWVLSSNGIYVAKVEEMLSGDSYSTIYYGADNGLPCIATANSYSYLAEDGTLYIAGSTGVAKVNMDEEFEHVTDFKMEVPYIEVDGKIVYPNKKGEFDVPSTANRVTIYSYVFNYSLMNPQVNYQLEGFDTDIRQVKRSDLMPITYTHLRGGTYHFLMSLQSPKGEVSKELSVTINKNRHLVERLWFQIIIGLLILGVIILLVLLVIYRRTRKYVEKANEQKQLIREIVEAFAKVIDMKDQYTNGHSTRVAEYTAMLTKELGYDEDTVERYYNIALMHDIGKVGIPAKVLNKPGKLTDEEYAIIKSHSALGYNALKGISIMPELAVGAGAHHERPDGKGYPNGLVGDQIPRVAQIIAVADTFDAMYSKRPYRTRMNFDKVVSIIKDVSGTQLTSDVVDAFLRLVEKGEFRAEDDDGGGSVEEIDNVGRK